MRPGVHFSWRVFAVAAVALLLALALIVASYQEYFDSLGLGVQYTVVAVALLVVALIGYMVGRPWALVVPWAVAAVWVVVGVIVEVARSSVDRAEPYGVMLLLIYAFWADVLIAGGLAVAVIRDWRR